MNTAIIDKLARERKRQKNLLAKTISDLEEQGKYLEEKAMAAAEIGNAKEYRAAHNAAEECGAELAVAKIRYSKMNAETLLSDEEADSIWKEYVREYNKLFDKLYADFESKRRVMLDAYKKLVDLQGEAIKCRERLAEYIGKGVVHIYHPVDKPYDDLFPCRCLPTDSESCKLKAGGTIIRNPDALFYYASKADEDSRKGIPDSDNSELQKEIGIIGRHTIKFL